MAHILLCNRWNVMKYISETQKINIWVIDVAALNLLPLVKVGLVVKLFNDEKAKGSFQMKENMILLNYKPSRQEANSWLVIELSLRE